jgi:hypothetical protein
MSKRPGDSDIRPVLEAKRNRTVAVPAAPPHPPAHTRMPDALWGLVARALPLTSAVALAKCCRFTFAAVQGPNGHQVSTEMTVPYSAQRGENCAVRGTHVSVHTDVELRLWIQAPQRSRCLTVDFASQLLGTLMLPSGLEELRLGPTFNQPMDHLVLPAGLRLLSFGNSFLSGFNQSVDNLVLPACLQQ